MQGTSEMVRKRVDKWMQEMFSGLTSRQIEEAIQAGLITIAGKKTKKGIRVSQSELEIKPLLDTLDQLKKGNSSLEIPVVYESKDFWIVDKPAGMPSHPLSLFENKTVTQWALARDPRVADEFKEAQPTVTPHRLDSGTSGLLVVCKTQQAFQQWRTRFQNKQVQKKYLAWCYGHCEQSSLFLNLPIGHSSNDPKKMVVFTGTEKFREPLMEAQTRAELLKEVGELSLWRISCSTGVTHQIRVHLASAGIPLVGDKLYDPLFDERKVKPLFHQLRATELQWEDGKIVLSEDDFGEPK